jgi:hypothetical protein
MDKTFVIIQVYIENEDVEIAKSNAKFLGMNLSQFICEAIKDKIEVIKKKKPAIIPLNFGSDTPTNIATTHNEIYDC